MSLYKVELEKAITKVQEEQAKFVCIQLPDGMKPEAKKIADAITMQTQAKVIIWLGSNFGACDVPLGLKRIGVDLLLSWGHNRFNKLAEGW